MTTLRDAVGLRRRAVRVGLGGGRALRHIPPGGSREEDALQGGAPVPDSAITAASALADDVPAPSLRIQISALQALCRQVFGFRLALIAVGVPFAMQNAADGVPRYLVLGAAVLAFMGSYALLRDWERFGPLLLRHPALMAVDLLFGSVLLLTASPDSPLGYAAACTPLLAGLLYGWRGSGVLTGIQIVVVVIVYRVWEDQLGSSSSTLLIAGFCVAAGIIGVTLRNLMFRFGTASQALADANARLAVAEAVGSERARLAREMHDSVAKTLHGVALAADALAAGADRMDPVAVRDRADLVARSARRAAAESRDILADLRRHSDGAAETVDVVHELADRTADFATRTGIPAELRTVGAIPVPPVPHAVARHLVTITAEALENAHRHAAATHVTAEVGVVGERLHVSVLDNGHGLPLGLTLDGLSRTGHFGLVGMVERAAAIGARIRIGRGRSEGGTEVRLDLPVAGLATTRTPAPPPDGTPPSPSGRKGPHVGLM